MGFLIIKMMDKMIIIVPIIWKIVKIVLRNSNANKAVTIGVGERIIVAFEMSK